MTPTQGDYKLTNTTLIECGSHRVSSRSVSWNATGNFLAMACSDRVARIWTVETTSSSSTSSTTGGGTSPAANANSASVREVLTVSGHTAAVTKVRFNPKESNQLATAAADKSVRIWDVRGASQRAMGRIDLVCAAPPLAAEWCAGSSSATILGVMERTGIYVYDTRKLASSTANTSSGRGAMSTTSAGNNALHFFPTRKHSVSEVCIFSPDGKYFITDESMYGESTGFLRIWPWDEVQVYSSSKEYKVSSHTPLYAMQFSPDGTLLATGGSDSTVGVWDADTMCCTHTVPRHLKFIRSVAFSHDSKILATSTEDGVDLADARTGFLIGSPNLGQRPRSGGAEDIAFHPKEYLLACARTDTPMGPPATPMTVVKLTIAPNQ